jgi:hypothetical protein
VQPLAKWVREVGTEPAGGVVLPSSEVDVLRTLIARSGDWSALAQHRAELRAEVVALLGCSLGVDEK